MEMNLKGTLVGIKRGKGDGLIEGKKLDWDYTAFYVMDDLPKKGGNALGQASQEYRFGKSDEFLKWEKIPFPVVVDLTLTMTTNGKGDSKVEVLEIKPSKDQPSRAAKVL